MLWGRMFRRITSVAPRPRRAEREVVIEAEIWVALAGVIGAIAFMLAGQPASDRFLPW
ncbi:hypothetical protein ACFQWF_00830 [Methylorubrum suomiense]|uniref:Uncharacterized protein n=1 Tax=Methylorubrum suomiense TaxID=144191 RepID=A0ABQ4V1W7_9HYPH|nr:hypothetical protein BGCPKDLD_5188 [Methylorubrum suomiense]